MDPDADRFEESPCHPHGPHVLPHLFEVGQRLSDNLLKAFDETAPAHIRDQLPSDLDLRRPLSRVTAKSLSASEEKVLAAIKEHVDQAHTIWRQILSKKERDFPSILKKPAKKNRGERNAGRKVDDMLPVTIHYYGPLPFKDEDIANVDVEDIMASYAYQISEPFGFYVAFKTLCKIKAQKSNGGIVASIRQIDELRAMSSTAGRFLRSATIDNNSQA